MRSFWPFFLLPHGAVKTEQRDEGSGWHFAEPWNKVGRDRSADEVSVTVYCFAGWERSILERIFFDVPIISSYIVSAVSLFFKGPTPVSWILEAMWDFSVSVLYSAQRNELTWQSYTQQEGLSGLCTDGHSQVPAEFVERSWKCEKKIEKWLP